jgi:hypothetical protein
MSPARRCAPRTMPRVVRRPRPVQHRLRAGPRATFGAAGALLHTSPGGTRLYGSDAAGAELTQFILPGHAGERAAAAGGRAIAKRLPTGPIKPILYIGGTFAPARRLDPRSLPPIKVKVSRDGKVTEFEIRPAGTESRVNDERHLAPTQASADGREAASLVARILITVDKAVDHAHVPPHVGG